MLWSKLCDGHLGWIPVLQAHLPVDTYRCVSVTHMQNICVYTHAGTYASIYIYISGFIICVYVCIEKATERGRPWLICPRCYLCSLWIRQCSKFPSIVDYWNAGQSGVRTLTALTAPLEQSRFLAYIVLELYMVCAHIR